MIRVSRRVLSVAHLEAVHVMTQTMVMDMQQPAQSLHRPAVYINVQDLRVVVLVLKMVRVRAIDSVRMKGQNAERNEHVEMVTVTNHTKSSVPCVAVEIAVILLCH